MNKKLGLGLILGATFVATTMAQQLTLEQVAAAKAKAAKMYFSNSLLSSKTMSLMSQDSPPTLPDPGTNNVGGENTNMPPIDYGQDYPIGMYDVGDCGSNPYIFYNLPIFSYWETFDDQPRDYKWSLTTSILSTNGHAAQSYPGYLMPNSYAVRSCMDCPWMTNHFDIWGDPVPHKLSFLYSFSGTGGDVFRLSLAYVQGDCSPIFCTNLPVTWQQPYYAKISVIVPAVSPSSYIATNFPHIMFTTYKNSGLVNQGPQAIVDPSIAWCPVYTPIPTANDFKVVRGQGATNVTVMWNTDAYRSNYWSLAFAGDINGPYSTNIGPATVTYSNNTARVVFSVPPTNVSRFYRLKHR